MENNQDKIRKPNAWVEFLKQKANENKSKYGVEILNPNNKVLYQKQKEQQQKKSEPKSKGKDKKNNK
jgi:hypothetical protein